MALLRERARGQLEVSFTLNQPDAQGEVEQDDDLNTTVFKDELSGGPPLPALVHQREVPKDPK